MIALVIITAECKLDLGDRQLGRVLAEYEVEDRGLFLVVDDRDADASSPTLERSNCGQPPTTLISSALAAVSKGW